MPASPPPITATVGFWLSLAELMSADAGILSPGVQLFRRCQVARAARTRHSFALQYARADGGRFRPASTGPPGYRRRSAATVPRPNGSTPARVVPQTQAPGAA